MATTGLASTMARLSIVRDTPTAFCDSTDTSSTSSLPSLSALPMPTKARRLEAPRVSTDMRVVVVAPTVLTNRSLRCRAMAPLT